MRLLGRGRYVCREVSGRRRRGLGRSGLVGRVGMVICRVVVGFEVGIYRLKILGWDLNRRVLSAEIDGKVGRW